MATIDADSFDAALKDFYTDEYIEDLTYEENPLWAMLTKKTNTGGRQYIQPVQYGIPQSISNTFSAAQNNKDTNKYEDFKIDYTRLYGAISLDRMSMLQTQGAGRKAFFEMKTREVDSLVKSITLRAAAQVFRDGGGSIGQVDSSGPSTTTFTLENVEDVVHFAPGMVLVASANNGTDSSHTLLNTGATAVVSAVDRDTGVITSSSNWTSQIAGLTNGSFLFPVGSFAGSGTGGGAAVAKGLLAWLPTTAPGGTDSFHSVNRSLDPTFLGGVRINVPTIPLHEQLRVAASRLKREGQAPDTIVMSHAKVRDLEIELGNKLVYAETPVTKTIGFDGIKLIGGNRQMMVYGDRSCPDNVAFMLRKDLWKLVAVEELPHVHNDAGTILWREQSSDGYEVRVSMYWNLACAAPGGNAVLTVEA